MTSKRRVPIAVVLALLALAATACGSPNTAEPASGSEGAWERLPQAPLEARRSAYASWLDGRLFVIGGSGAAPCPPTADCIEPSEASFDDGAVYDPQTRSWEPIVPAPAPVGVGSTAVAGDRIYFLLHGIGSSHPDERPAFLAYDAGADRWHELARPAVAHWSILTAVGDSVLAYQQSQENGVEPDLMYDPATNAWNKLPADPLIPSFDRTIVATHQGLVLFGIENVPQPGIEPSFYRVAILRNATWHRLADSEVVGFDPVWWAAQGDVINARVGELDGGETNNWGRPYPTGGSFDPRRGEWRSLPDAPEAGAFTGVYAGNDRWIVQGQGLVLDARDRRWLELTAPPGGAIHETAAAWTDDGLVVWGGVRWDGSDGMLLAEGWIWRPST